MNDRVAELEAELARARAELDRAQAEKAELTQQLAEMRHYRNAVENSSTSTICVQGNRCTYVFANRAFANVLGRDHARLLEMDPYAVWLEVTHPEDVERERVEIERIAKGELDGFQMDKRMRGSDGEYHWYRVDAIAERDAQGRLDTLTCSFVEIDEQRRAAATRDRLEGQLREVQKLGALGKLAGGVAHDFNNRLVIIMGYTELIKRELPPESPLSQHAEMVLTSAERAAELTRQLLAYSRRQVLKPEAFDLNRTVDSMRRLLERLIGEDIELLTVLGAEYPIFSDPGQIEQVILNLAINARDAMPSGGRILLETSSVALPYENDLGLPPGPYVALVVSDTGTGIPAEVLPHIFEPFFTTKEVGHGTGLGLSMVEGIVQQSGGAVRVDTRVGHGTSFTLYLPRATAVEAPVSSGKEAPVSSDVHFETILVCDDDDGVRRLLVDVLGFRAYRILEARNGKHALEIAAAHEGPIHLLLTDLVMPELGGVELAAELRKRHPLIRVLYLSGYTDSKGVLSGPLEPNTHFLAKPFLPGELTRAVSSIVEGGHPPTSPRTRGLESSEQTGQ